MNNGISNPKSPRVKQLYQIHEYLVLTFEVKTLFFIIVYRVLYIIKLVEYYIGPSILDLYYNSIIRVKKYYNFITTYFKC